ncbi:MAG: CDP-alcohol phosphatidyltransferase family protein [bacterium]|nr:CDP-alcohol phosphatidyltransferase family protein [bacterium]
MLQLTVTDKILQRILLPLIPRFVTPNMVTWFRFITVPFVAYLFLQEFYLAGLLLFVVSAFSDAVDGSLARTRDQVTDWGKMYDPAADKLLIGLAAFILVSKFLNWYLAATIIGIEFFLIVGAYYRRRFHGVPIEAEFSGKIKMVLQSLGVAAILLSAVFHIPTFLTIAAYLLYLAIVFAIISLAVYKSI